RARAPRETRAHGKRPTTGARVRRSAQGSAVATGRPRGDRNRALDVADPVVDGGNRSDLGEKLGGPAEDHAPIEGLRPPSVGRLEETRADPEKSCASRSRWNRRRRRKGGESPPWDRRAQR